MNQIVAEIQAVIDRLHSEGHAVATKLENALHDLKAHFTKDAATDLAEAKADAEQVKTDAAPVAAEVKADAEKVATEVKGQLEAGLAEAEDVANVAKANVITKP